MIMTPWLEGELTKDEFTALRNTLASDGWKVVEKVFAEKRAVATEIACNHTLDMDIRDHACGQRDTAKDVLDFRDDFLEFEKTLDNQA